MSNEVDARDRRDDRHVGVMPEMATRPDITVVDYGMGNIGSILNMMRKLGVSCIASRDPEELTRARRIILPGVGAFDEGMRRLRACGLVEVLIERVAGGTPTLGICLGLQLLAHSSDEGNEPGLGWLPGHVRRLHAPSLPVPQMGWNSVMLEKPTTRLPALGREGARFYFVHSYALECTNSSDVLATASYGERFVAAVERDNVLGVQFHPEKSHRYGMRILEDFACIPEM